MKVLDRIGNEIKIGSKIAWVATSYGSAYLKIGTVVSIDIKHTGTHDDDKYDFESRKWVKTGKVYNSYDLVVKADILHPYDLNRRYIARMPERVYIHESDNDSCKINRVEVV